MRLTMKERRRLAEATAGRYRKASKKEKQTILNEFVEATGFARSYGALVLRNQGGWCIDLFGRQRISVRVDFILRQRGEAQNKKEISDLKFRSQSLSSRTSEIWDLKFAI
jgi:hypothetical protein